MERGSPNQHLGRYEDTNRDRTVRIVKEGKQNKDDFGKMASSESRYRDNHKDSQIAALSKRLRMENEVSTAQEQTKNTLRDESRRWQVKYEQL